MVSPRNFTPSSIFKSVKNLTQKFSDYKLINRAAKSSVFSTLSFVAIFIMIYADSLVSNLSIHPTDLIRNKEFFENSKMFDAKSQLQSSSVSTLQEVSKKVDDVEAEAVDPLIPPINITREERISWFRRKLPELEILHSTNLSQKFHGRVLEFFNNNCTVQFYMIWLSPASTFGPREFLAADTLFKANPDACLIIVSRSMDSKYGYRILKPLHDMGFKVLSVTPDLPFLVQNTPAEAWLNEMKSGRRDPGYIPLSINLSNLIRVTMLYKYGGVYLDTDFIILKDFSGLRNVVGAQSVDEATNQWTRINGAVMSFDMNHPILMDFIKEFSTTFNGNKWGHNGPYLISRVIQRVGDTPGYNVSVLPPSAFYPVDWVQIRKLFRKPSNGADSRWVEETLGVLMESHALHLWNKRSRKLIIEDGSVMDRLTSDHCVVCQHINHS